MTLFKSSTLLTLLTVPLMIGACTDESGPVGVAPTLVAAADAVSPAVLNLTDLVTVDLAGSSLEFWPYTGRTPTLGDAADPINLVLGGSADPRVLRARLMFLDGDRSATIGNDRVVACLCEAGDPLNRIPLEQGGRPVGRPVEEASATQGARGCNQDNPAIPRDRT